MGSMNPLYQFLSGIYINFSLYKLLCIFWVSCYRVTFGTESSKILPKDLCFLVLFSFLSLILIITTKNVLEPQNFKYWLNIHYFLVTDPTVPKQKKRYKKVCLCENEWMNEWIPFSNNVQDNTLIEGLTCTLVGASYNHERVN